MSGLRRKESLRDAYARKLKAMGVTFRPAFQRHGQRGEWTWKKRKPLKKVSRSQRERLKKYYPIRNAFLAQHPHCIICVIRGKVVRQATEVHHRFGRNGSLLCDPRGFAASCRDCRDWPHENPRKAREIGLLGEAWEWGVPIDQHRKPSP